MTINPVSVSKQQSCISAAQLALTAATGSCQKDGISNCSGNASDGQHLDILQDLLVRPKWHID